MRSSEDINEIAKALCLAQQSMKPAAKDAINPHFKSKFADFASIWDAIRVPVTSNGLTILQDATTGDKCVSVTTRIMHTSGQWIEFGPLTIPLAKFDAHGIGSGVTYAKRYALSSAMGVTSSDEDDDGNVAVAEPKQKKEQEEPEFINQEQYLEITKLLDGNVDMIDWFTKRLSSLKVGDPKKIPAKWFSDVCMSINKKRVELGIS